MPSFPLSQFSDLEEMMMCKQLLNLDLREQNSRPPPALGQGMRSPGLIGQPHSNSSTSFSLSSLSCLPGPDTTSDGVLLTANQWGQGQQQQPESPLPSQSHQLAHPTQWAKTGFLAQRSLSMVETSSSSSGISTSLASLGGWPGAADLTQSQSDISSPSTRYKTELCRSFTESGLCKYGGKCQFAHGQDELRDLNRHPKYKTEPCRTFHTVGFCPYGIRCHFVHNNEEEHLQGYSRSSSSSSSSSSGVSYHHHQQQQPPLSSSSRLHRPPLVRQSFSFAGFPSAPQLALQPALLSPHPPPHAAFSLAVSPASPPSCADITDLLSHAFLEMDSAFEASPAHSLYQQQQPPLGQVAAEAEAAELADPRSPFLPSPDSGCSPSGLSPSASPSLRQSPGVTALGVFSSSEPMGTRSLSYTSLSDQDQDGSSSASSLSGSESCGGLSDANGRRLAVFSQLSVPEDATGLCL